MSETLPLARVKAHLFALVDRVSTQQARIVVTRNGRSAAGLQLIAAAIPTDLFPWFPSRPEPRLDERQEPGTASS